MAVNKRKVLEAARKHATKGAKEKALKEYDKLLKLDPRDAKLRLEIGDTHRRWGQIVEAAEIYSKVAEQFMKEGFDARAVAVYKQILNLDPESFACYEPLSELYQRMGLTSEATAALQTAADGYHRAGDKTAALGLLRKMAMLEPTNTTSRLKVADLLHKEDMKEDAIIEYEAVLEELLAQGDAEAVSTVYERLLEVEPDRLTSLTGYARNLIDRGSPDQAEPFARRALEADANPPQYELLGEVLRAAGRDEELVALYRELAELYRERGDEERTREILQRYVPPEEFSSTTEPNGYIEEDELAATPAETSIAPDAVDDLDSFDELAPLDDDRDDFGDENTLLDEDLMADDSQMLGNGESGMGIITNLDSGSEIPITGPANGSDANEMTRIIPEEAAPSSVDVDQLFAEASVYLRYGKRDQAVANLESVLDIDPSHRGALEKLGEAFVEADDKPRAVEVWSRAAKLALEDDEIEAANAIRDRISSIDETAAAELVLDTPVGDPDTQEAPVPDDLKGDGADDIFGESLSDLDPPAASESDLEEIELDDIEIDIDDESFALDPKAQLDVEPQAEETAANSSVEDESEAMTYDGSAARESNPKQIAEDIEEADFYMEQGLLDEAAEIYTRVLEVAPNHPHAMVRMGEVAAQRGDDPGSSVSAAGSGEPPTAIELEVPVSPDASDASDGLDISEELSDWNDDLSQNDELDLGPIGDELTGSDSFDEEIDEQELSVADLSAGSFTPIDGTTRSANDSDGDTKDLPDDLIDDTTGPFGDSSGALSAPLDEDSDETGGGAKVAADDEIEIEFDSDADVDFDMDSSDSESEDLAGETPTGEFPLEPPIEDSDATSGSLSESDVPTEDPVVPELAVTSIDFGDEQEAVDDEGEGEAEEEPEGDDFGFDLAAEIGQALDEDPNESSSGNSADTSDDGFAAVFAEFKKGVSETLTDGDHEAHYDLGIAYREMGLLDDAMAEFRAAMESPTRRLGCLHLLGLCALDARQPEDATAHLQMALDTDDLGAEQTLALRLDLGRCFEQSGDTESARVEFLAVQAENPKFGDVGARLEGLDDLEKPALEEEIQYESFDDFFSDDDDEQDDSDDEPESYESFEDVISESDAEPSDADREVEDVPEATVGDSAELAFDASAVDDVSELTAGDGSELAIDDATEHPEDDVWELMDDDDVSSAVDDAVETVAGDVPGSATSDISELAIGDFSEPTLDDVSAKATADAVERVADEAPELAAAAPPEPAAAAPPEPAVEQDGAPVILEMEAIVEPEPAMEFEPQFEPEAALEVAPEPVAEAGLAFEPEVEPGVEDAEPVSLETEIEPVLVPESEPDAEPEPEPEPKKARKKRKISFF